MLSSHDESCKLEFRSERIPYYSVISHSVFSSNCPKKGWKDNSVLGRLFLTFPKKELFFFRSKKYFAHVI